MLLARLMYSFMTIDSISQYITSVGCYFKPTPLDLATGPSAINIRGHWFSIETWFNPIRQNNNSTNNNNIHYDFYV